MKFVKEYWDNAEEVIAAIDSVEKTPMTISEFLTHTTHAGNLSGRVLTGIKKLYPTVYQTIPNDMGRYAFECLCEVTRALGITKK